MIKAVLFDLDGTLLDVDMDDFLQRYLHTLSGHFSEFTGPQEFTHNLLAATQAMICNMDPKKTNQDTFNEHFFKWMPHPPEIVLPLISEFYQQLFPELQVYVKQFPQTPLIINTAQKAGFRLVLATNPVFPSAAIRHRMTWAGIYGDPFELVTSYEVMHYCKPFGEYYLEIAAFLGVQPNECLMIGNDLDDDIAAAASTGMKTFLVTDRIVHKSERNVSPDYSGTIGDVAPFLITLKEYQREEESI